MNLTVYQGYFYYLEKYSKNPPECCTFAACHFCVQDYDTSKPNYMYYCMVKGTEVRLGIPCSCEKYDFIRSILEVI